MTDHEIERALPITIHTENQVGIAGGRKILCYKISLNGNAPVEYYSILGITCPKFPTDKEIADDLNKIASERMKFRNADPKTQDNVWKASDTLAGLLTDPEADTQLISNELNGDYGKIKVQNALRIICINSAANARASLEDLSLDSQPSQ